MRALPASAALTTREANSTASTASPGFRLLASKSGPHPGFLVPDEKGNSRGKNQCKSGHLPRIAMEYSSRFSVPPGITDQPVRLWLGFWRWSAHRSAIPGCSRCHERVSSALLSLRYTAHHWFFAQAGHDGTRPQNYQDLIKHKIYLV